MNLEHQVCSLELSKKLKELGVEQESLFYWTKPHYEDNLPFVCWYEEKFVNGTQKWEQYSAFTVAELGEMLPCYLWGRFLTINKSADGSWVVFYEENVIGFTVDKTVLIEDQVADTEADARSKMLIYLLENKLITL